MLQLRKHRGLSKIKIYHLQKISHQVIRWTADKSQKKEKKTSLAPETPALTHAHEKSCPFKVTLGFLSFKISDETLSSVPMPFF